MSVATNHVRERACIAATARYVPQARVQPDVAFQQPADTPSFAREIIMRSVYADTLRWSREVAGSGPVDHSSKSVRFASEPRHLLSEMASMVAREAIRRYPGKDKLAPDQIIVCATSFEHDLALSCAGRLRFAHGPPRCHRSDGHCAGPCAALRWSWLRRRPPPSCTATDGALVCDAVDEGRGRAAHIHRVCMRHSPTGDST
jgi:hypothetical protein